MNTTPTPDERRIHLVAGDTGRTVTVRVGGFADLAFVSGAGVARIWPSAGGAAETVTATVTNTAERLVDIAFGSWPAARTPGLYFAELKFNGTTTVPEDPDLVLEIEVRAPGGA